MTKGWGLPWGSTPRRLSPLHTATLSCDTQGPWAALPLAHPPHLISQPPCPHMASDRPLSLVDNISPVRQTALWELGAACPAVPGD